jgi:hypothetical protein
MREAMKIKLTMELDMNEKELAAALQGKIAEMGTVVEAVLGMFDTLRAAVNTQSDVSPELLAASQAVDAQRAALVEALQAIQAQPLPGVTPV